MSPGFATFDAKPRSPRNPPLGELTSHHVQYCLVFPLSSFIRFHVLPQNVDFVSPLPGVRLLEALQLASKCRELGQMRRDTRDMAQSPAAEVEL